jgi:ubiquinone biosynthesis protein UbiJ
VATRITEPTAAELDASEGESLTDRVSRLEAEVADLRGRLESLERDLGR